MAHGLSTGQSYRFDIIYSLCQFVGTLLHFGASYSFDAHVFNIIEDVTPSGGRLVDYARDTHVLYCLVVE